MTGGDGPLRAIDRLNIGRGRITRAVRFTKKRKSVKKNTSLRKVYKSFQRFRYKI